jgi:hypothetical protein
MSDPESPVQDASEFFGHAGLVRRIFSRIGAERPQSIALIGGKKSGKTSLLNHIADEGVRRAFLEKPDSFVFAKAAAGTGQVADPESFLSTLVGLLPGFSEGSANRYEGVRRTVDALHASGKRVVVLLDDFHAITQNERFPLEFFSFLRSIANNYNLAYLTTSFLALQKLCVIKDVQESPFFNIFTNLSLGMPAPEDARKLFAHLTGTDEGTAARITAWCGCSPYLLKKAAVRLMREKGFESLGDVELERILLPEAAPFLQEIVSMLPPEAAKALAALSRGAAPNPADVHHVDSLVKQGFLSESSETLTCSSVCFLSFLKRSFTPKMLKGRG